MINLIQPISFYDRLEEQSYKMENSPSPAKFLADKRLIPFQIKMPESSQVVGFRLVGFKYQFEIDLITENIQSMEVVPMGNYSYFLFYGGENLFFRRLKNYPNLPPEYTIEPLGMCSDYYHYEVSLASGKKYYSEKFYYNGTGGCDSPITLEINAWNNTDKNDLIFQNGFKFKSYFNTFIYSQQANITDDFDKDGFERQILKSRVIQFPYSFAPDPLPQVVTNGLALLTAFDNFVVIENGNEYITEFVQMEIEDVEGTNLNTSIFTFRIKGQDVIKTFC